MLYVIILAIVQGLCEFLPVSSSGHLVLLNKFFGIENDFLQLSIIFHLATLFSVVWVLRKEVLAVAKHPFGSMGKKLIFASVPTVLMVLLFKGVIDKAFGGGFLPVCFMITAVLIVLSEILSKSKKEKGEITNKTAVFMGLAQGVATLPGISRSGATICSGLMAGKDRKETAHFSFLMSIPIIIASLVFEVLEYAFVGQAISILWYEIFIGFVVAFVVGVFAVKFVLKLIEKYSLIPFAIYLIGVSIFSFFVVF